jgi:hypothetical protein
MILGRIVRLLTDTKRKELLNDVDEKRKIIVSIFYPAHESFKGSRQAVYMDLFYPRADAFIKRFAGRKNKLGEQLSEDYLKSIKINTYNNAPISRSIAKYPVIIYSPGLGMDRDSLIYIIEKLVSQGYIVITVGHIYDSEFTIVPTGEIIHQTKNFDDASLEEKEQLVDIRKKDILFLIDELEGINNEDTSILGALDLNKLGVIGHSMGGAAVFKVAATDPRIKAVVLLDAALHYVNLEKEINEGILLNTPLLNFRKGSIDYEEGMKKAIKHFAAISDGETFKRRIILQDQVLTRQRKGQKELYEYLSGYKSFIKLKDSEHLTFTDLPVIYNQALENDVLPIPEAHEVISEITVRFFNEFLCGTEADYRNFINSTHCPRVCMIDKLGELVE